MEGPCGTMSELGELETLAGGNGNVVKERAEEKFEKGKPPQSRVEGTGGQWYGGLDIFRATGEDGKMLPEDVDFVSKLENNGLAFVLREVCGLDPGRDGAVSEMIITGYQLFCGAK